MADYALKKTGEQIDALQDKAIVKVARSYNSVATLTRYHPHGDNNLYRVGDSWYFWQEDAWVKGGDFYVDDSSKYDNGLITLISDIADIYKDTGFPVGHVFYDTTTKCFYTKIANAPYYEKLGIGGVLCEPSVVFDRPIDDLTVGQCYDQMGVQVFTATYRGDRYILQCKDADTIVGLNLAHLYLVIASGVHNASMVSVLGNHDYHKNLFFTGQTIDTQGAAVIASCLSASDFQRFSLRIDNDGVRFYDGNTLTGTYLWPSRNNNVPDKITTYQEVKGMIESLEDDYITPEFNSINTKITDIQQLAEAYISTGRTYSPGEIVIYNNVFYRCIAETTGNWQANSWTPLTFDYITQMLMSVDDHIDPNSHNPVENGVIADALDEKADKDTEINGHSLDDDINLSPSDLGLTEATDAQIDAIFN